MTDSVILSATTLHDAVTVEYQWLGDASRDAPVVVFPCEADESHALAASLGMRVLVVFRRSGDSLHQHACQVLPALFDALSLDRRLWIVGARKGATIALHYAIAHSKKLAGVVLIAPTSIAGPSRAAELLGTRAAFESTNFARRLAGGRAIDDVTIRCPVLVLSDHPDDDPAIDFLQHHVEGPLEVARFSPDEHESTIVRFIARHTPLSQN